MTPAEPVWRKSSRSGSGAQSDCVELAALDDSIGIRDSKNPQLGHLTICRDSLRDLVGRVKVGDWDL
ncbi:DUF397 domain-containing protein [Actinomadura sp. KC06]|uniref:DUF397 domain-containing protein n=1 Tax=Actinomadura sp. KC06 TaxID=2530369 RepID=UPI00104A2AC8|nr:DUF397 domain-containing protein [Actinomadura sp. KC06]TDD29286.1 DUF397 domain-containing protein [Actinomadura sp. KC06]